MTPRARRTELSAFRDEAVLVRVAAPPAKGAVNKALIAFLAGLLRVPRHSIRLIHGERSRQKRIAVAGVTAESVRNLLRSP